MLELTQTDKRRGSHPLTKMVSDFAMNAMSTSRVQESTAIYAMFALTSATITAFSTQSALARAIS